MTALALILAVVVLAVALAAGFISFLISLGRAQKRYVEERNLNHRLRLIHSAAQHNGHLDLDPDKDPDPAP